MELKTYLGVLASRWWIVLPITLITFLATAVLTFEQTPLYQSTATQIVKVRASASDDRGVLSALDALSRNSVSSTFAEVASSRLIRAEAAERLGVSPAQLRDVSVSSRALVGTNVIEITALAPDPILARDFATAVGAATASHVRRLYDPYDLQALDTATLANAPAKPDVALSLLLGGVLGLLFGAGLAYLSEYLHGPTKEDASEQREQLKRVGA